MRNLVLRACCCLAGLTTATGFLDVSNRSIVNLEYPQLVPRTNSRPPSPEKPGSSSKSKYSAGESSSKIGESIKSSVRFRLPSQGGDGSEASSSQVLRKPSAAQPLGNLMKTLDAPVMRKQAVQLSSKSLELPISSKQPSKGPRLKRNFTPGPLKLNSPPRRPQLINPMPPSHLTGVVRGKYTALTIADGPAYLEAGVLGQPSTSRVVLPGRTAVLSMSHDKDTVWATGNVGKGSTAIAAAMGEGVTAQALAGYEGKGYMKTYGPENHATHTDVPPGKKEEQQWESLDPERGNMAVLVGVDGPGQATAGGLSMKHTSTGKDYRPGKDSQSRQAI